MNRIMINGAAGGVGLFALPMAGAAGLRCDTISSKKAFAALREHVAGTMQFREIGKAIDDGGDYLSNLASLPTIAGDFIGRIGRKLSGSWRTRTFNWVRPSGRMPEEIAGMIERGGEPGRAARGSKEPRIGYR